MTLSISMLEKVNHLFYEVKLPFIAISVVLILIPLHENILKKKKSTNADEDFWI